MNAEATSRFGQIDFEFISTKMKIAVNKRSLINNHSQSIAKQIIRVFKK